MRGVILSGVLAVASMAAMAETEPLTVLQVLDLSGQNGDTGKDFVAGAKVYFDYINSRGGINGRKIRHVLADDQGQPQHTLKLTRQALQDEKPVALFGYLGADNLAAVLDDPQLRQRGLPMVGPYSGMAGRQWPNLFPVKAAYADEVIKILHMTSSLGINRIGVFYGNDTLGKAASSSVEHVLASKRLPAAVRVAYFPNRNIALAAQTMAQQQPQAVILAAPTMASAQFVRECQQLLPGTQFFALSSVNHQTLLEFLGPKQAQGIAVTALTPSPYNPVTPIARDYVKHWQQFRDEAVSYASIDGYISARALVEGLKLGSKGGSYQAAFANMKPLELGGYQVNFNAGSSNFVDVLVFSQQGRLMN
ncbi:MAG: Peripla 6 protein [Pseudomonadota bacterium]|nr:Peripla 6 protein [Pseudomonadota bacterium]